MSDHPMLETVPPQILIVLSLAKAPCEFCITLYKGHLTGQFNSQEIYVFFYGFEKLVYNT